MLALSFFTNVVFLFFVTVIGLIAFKYHRAIVYFALGMWIGNLLGFIILILNTRYPWLFGAKANIWSASIYVFIILLILTFIGQIIDTSRMYFMSTGSFFGLALFTFGTLFIQTRWPNFALTASWDGFSVCSGFITHKTIYTSMFLAGLLLLIYQSLRFPNRTIQS